jgi:hypothetical protein
LQAKKTPRYAKELEPLGRGYSPNFGEIALELVSQFPRNAFTAIIHGDEDMRRWFLMMRHLSFFQGGFGDAYNMFIPHRIGIAGTKIAVLAGLRMTDPKYYRRPEYSSSTVSGPYALEMRERRVQALSSRLH